MWLLTARVYRVLQNVANFCPGIPYQNDDHPLKNKWAESFACCGIVVTNWECGKPWLGLREILPKKYGSSYGRNMVKLSHHPVGQFHCSTISHPSTVAIASESRLRCRECLLPPCCWRRNFCNVPFILYRLLYVGGYAPHQFQK